MGSSSLVTLPPGFQLLFYFHLCMCVVHWSLLLRLPWRAWFCPMRARCGGAAAAWVAEVLVVSGSIRGVGGQGSRKYSALEG